MMLKMELPGTRERNTIEEVYGRGEEGHAGRGRHERCRGQNTIEVDDPL